MTIQSNHRRRRPDEDELLDEEEDGLKDDELELEEELELGTPIFPFFPCGPGAPSPLEEGSLEEADDGLKEDELELDDELVPLIARSPVKKVALKLQNSGLPGMINARQESLPKDTRLSW